MNKIDECLDQLVAATFYDSGLSDGPKKFLDEHKSLVRLCLKVAKKAGCLQVRHVSQGVKVHTCIYCESGCDESEILDHTPDCPHANLQALLEK